MARSVTSSAQGSTYAVYTSDGRRSLPFQTTRGVDMVPLEQVATLFSLSLTEDSLVGGLVVRGRGQTILLIPGQSFASVGPGRLVSLPAPVERDRRTWYVPVDFIRQVLAPTLNVRVEVRRANRVVLIGDVRLPQVTGRFDRQGTTGRLLFDVQPAAPHRVSRQGNRVTIGFDAVALDFTPVQGLLKEFVTSLRVDGPSIVIEMDASVASIRTSDMDATHFLVEFLPPAPVSPPVPATPTPAPRPAQEPTRPAPAIDTAPGTLRTVVLDPGHGGDESGVVGPGGTLEKDYVLQFAKLLESAIQARIGLRVLLTRETDESVPLDRRASIANNNKADLFISLHANGSRLPAVSGAQVLSLNREDYRSAVPSAAADLPVAFIGGGTRFIELLPWDLAQVGFTRRSSSVRALLETRLREAEIPIVAGGVSELALRPVAGASMPAVMIELGFLSNPDEEKALNSTDRQQRTIGAIVDVLVQIRRGIPDLPERPQ